MHPESKHTDRGRSETRSRVARELGRLGAVLVEQHDVVDAVGALIVAVEGRRPRAPWRVQLARKT